MTQQDDMQQKQIIMIRQSLMTALNQQYTALIQAISTLPFAAEITGRKRAIDLLNDSFVWALQMVNFEQLILAEPKKTDETEELKEPQNESTAVTDDCVSDSAA